MLACKALFVWAALAAVPEGSMLTRADSWFGVRLQAELGFLAPMAHHIQLSRDGSDFDLVKEGGQDVLFPFLRLAAEANVAERHALIFLYQPLQLDTRVSVKRALRFEGAPFAANVPLDVRYGFSFWRLSYQYGLINDGRNELWVGASLQLRDAVIDFTDRAGGTRRSVRDVGPVPLLKVRGRLALGDEAWVGTDIDGVYAPIKYINGSRTDVVGALLDASVAWGVDLLHGISPFVSLRYLGGGAEGTSRDAKDYGDGFTRNWLHFLTLSLGVALR